MSIFENTKTLASSTDLKTIFVFGAYGSGTTAVTGVLLRLGGKTLSGLSVTNDPRTPTSLEDLGFKSVLHELIDENIIGFWPNVSEQIALNKLSEFRSKLEHDHKNNLTDSAPYILKQPLAALLVYQIQKVFNPRIVYVTRSLEDIEKSRIRRKWGELKGSRGAKYIYHVLMSAVLEFAIQPIWIHYSQLEKNPNEVVDILASLMGVNVSDSKKADAVSWLSTHFLANER